MSTNLKVIKSTNGIDESAVWVTVFLGSSKLVTEGKETTPVCIQLTTATQNCCGTAYANLTDSAIRKLIEQLQSVIDRSYAKFEEL